MNQNKIGNEFLMMSGQLNISENNFKAGDYVLATKFSDADCRDRWIIDVIESIHLGRALFKPTGQIGYRYAQKITAEQGLQLISKYKNPPFDKY